MLIYRDALGREPLTSWLEQQEHGLRSAVLRRLGRVADGILGNAKPVGDGVHEIRFSLGTGARVFFGQDGPVAVAIQCADSKGSLRQDVEKAKSSWRDYLEAKP